MLSSSEYIQSILSHMVALQEMDAFDVYWTQTQLGVLREIDDTLDDLVQDLIGDDGEDEEDV